MFPANADQVVTSIHAAHAWSIALETAHARALYAYPQEHKRINAALALLETGGVRVSATHAVVESQTKPGTQYRAHATCECAWFTYGAQAGESRRCAHRWAYLLYYHGIEKFVNLYAAVYESMDNDGKVHKMHGFAQLLPEDSGHLFFHQDTGDHRFLPAPCSNLTLLGKVAWIEGGKLCGSLPQALLDLSPKR